jgi:hypothetical protein
VHVASIGEKRKIKYILLDNSQGKRTFEIPRHRKEENIKEDEPTNV